MMRSLVRSMVFTLMVVGASHNARACECASSGPPCQNVFSADAVFAGTVQNIADAPDRNPPYRQLSVAFAQVTPFRGMQGTTATLFTTDSTSSCGYPFKQGERYLVYAHRTKDGNLEVGSCSRTRPLADATEDLQFLRATGSSAAGAHVSGVSAITSGANQEARQ
jgi:hypothetical protein